MEKHFSEKMLLNIILFFTLVSSLFMTQSYFGTDNYGKLYNLHVLVFLVLFTLISVKSRGCLKFSRLEWYLYEMVTVPYLIMLFISPFLVVWSGSMSLLESVKSASRPTLMILSAIMIYHYYGRNAVDVLFYAACLNYSIYIIEFIRNFGIKGFLNYIVITNTQSKVLEVHELTFIFGLFIVYYMWMSEQNHAKVRLAISIVFCFLGFKRILAFALMIVFLLYIILKSGVMSEQKFVRFFPKFLFSFCILWILISSGDILSEISKVLNFSLMGRDRLARLLEGKYTISPFYVGKGIGYVHRVLTDYAASITWYTTTGFHNDILKYYIELGAILCVVLYLNITCWNTKRLMMQASVRAAMLYLFLMTLTLFGWATDNLSTYPNYLVAFHVILFDLLLNNTQRFDRSVAESRKL